MLESVKDDILVIPTHPMFGPYVSSISSQTFVLTPEEKVKTDDSGHYHHPRLIHQAVPCVGLSTPGKRRQGCNGGAGQK